MGARRALRLRQLGRHVQPRLAIQLGRGHLAHGFVRRRDRYDGQMAYVHAKRGQVLLAERWARDGKGEAKSGGSRLTRAGSTRRPSTTHTANRKNI